MFRKKTIKKNATALEPGDVITIAGENYIVVENRQNEFSYHKRSLTLTSVIPTSDEFGDRVYVIMPSFLPMLIRKK